MIWYCCASCDKHDEPILWHWGYIQIQILIWLYYETHNTSFSVALNSDDGKASCADLLCETSFGRVKYYSLRQMYFYISEEYFGIVKVLYDYSFSELYQIWSFSFFIKKCALDFWMNSWYQY